MKRFGLTTFFVLALSVGIAIAAEVATIEALKAKFSQLEQQYQLPAEILAKVAQIESSGNARAGSPGRAYGMFQWMPSSWVGATKALYGAPRNLDDRTNPFIAAEVTAFELGRTKSRIGNLIAQAKVDLSVGLYMGHFLGPGGSQKFFQYFIVDPNQNATALFPLEAKYNPGVFNGKTLAGVLNYFAAKMKAPGITGVSNYSTTFDGNPTASRIMDSLGTAALTKPFTGPLPPQDPNRTYVTDYSTGAIAATTTAVTVPPVSQSLTTIPVGSTGSQPSAGLGDIFVQPAVIRLGASITLAWTSVHMRTSGCSISNSDGETVAQVNEGSRRLTPKDTGSISYDMKCVDEKGNTFNASATVQVQ